MGGRNGLTTRHAATGGIASDERVALHTVEPARRRRTTPVPATLPARVQRVLADGGISELHAFQGEAIALLRAGTHVVLAGTTGSGKSLCYQVPVLEALEVGRGTALYLSPTKALAQDQARRFAQLGGALARPLLYDGDTPARERALVRRTGRFVLTNPDMLSAGILPGHGDWAPFLARLAYVVVDEAHVYRGVFGSHVAQVLRRLRRICAAAGSEPTFAFTSGTIANPAGHAQRLAGLDATVVGDRGAPSPGRDVVLWNPEFDEQAERRDSPLGDAARLYVQLLEAGVATIVFARSRRSCELVHSFACDRLESRDRSDLVARIAPYRAGYTPEQRRATERSLASGELVGVVATSALELGIDVGTLEACINVTFPGTVTSLRQQWGRAGRGRRRGLAVLVAGEDALDQYFMRHPRALVDRPVETATISLENPRIVTPHIAAAAAELPLGGAVDAGLWGPALEPAMEELRAAGRLHQTRTGYTYTGRDRPAGGLALRSTGRGDVAIVDRVSGQLLGTVDVGRAAATVYPGAVYLHRGVAYVVEHLDVQALVASVERRSVPWYTMPRIDTRVETVGALARRRLEHADTELVHGRVIVHEQLVGYQRRRTDNHEVIDHVHVELPPLDFPTEAVWFAAPPVIAGRFDAERLLGSLHAGEHALIALLPLLAMCDRWDIGGLSTDWHEAFEGPGVFVYDGHAGGIGITAAGFDAFDTWAEAARSAVAECPCDDGCPSCVQSPKCGNLNEMLDKAAALELLTCIATERR